jgi:hypothetical protein
MKWLDFVELRGVWTAHHALDDVELQNALFRMASLAQCILIAACEKQGSEPIEGAINTGIQHMTVHQEWRSADTGVTVRRFLVAKSSGMFKAVTNLDVGKRGILTKITPHGGEAELIGKVEIRGAGEANVPQLQAKSAKCSWLANSARSARWSAGVARCPCGGMECRPAAC